MKNIILTIGIILVLLSGCGQDTTAGGETELQDSTPKLKVGYLPLIDHMTLMVADGNDMFNGIEVEPVKFTDWPSLVEAMMSKNLDGVHVINNLAVKMTLNGLEAKTLVLSHREAIDLATKEGIETAEDLRGTTIAVPSRFSPHYMMLVNYMSENGLEVGVDYDVLDVAPPDFVSTMASGSVDGFIGSEPFPTIAEAKGVGKIFKTASEMMIDGSNGLDCVVVFHDSVISENPGAMQAYVDAIVEAGELIESSPAEASAIASPYLLNQDPKLIEDTLKRSRFEDLMPRVSEYEALQDYAVGIELLPQAIDLDEFVDDSYAKKAYEKLSITLE